MTPKKEFDTTKVKLNCTMQRNSDRFINITHVHSKEQRAVMKQIQGRKECPFCIQNLHKYHTKPIIRKIPHWILTPARWPYKDTKLHLLVISRKHMERLSDLSLVAGRELFKLLKWVERKYNISGGAFAVRFGDSRFTGATVHHLHAHVIQPRRTSSGKAVKVVHIPIG